MGIFIKNKDKDRREMARQAAMISMMLLYTSGLAKFQNFMDGQEKYARYVLDNARLLGFKPPKKLTPEKISVMMDSAKAIARLENQAFQTFNHHQNALEIFPELLLDLRKFGLDIVWETDTPERLKDIIFWNREKFQLDNFDYPRGAELFACNLSDRMYQNTEHSMLHPFLNEADKLGLAKFVFYPQFKSFFNSPPPEKQPRRGFFQKQSEEPLVGGNGKSVLIKDESTLSYQFREKSIVVGYKYR